MSGGTHPTERDDAKGGYKAIRYDDGQIAWFMFVEEEATRHAIAEALGWELVPIYGGTALLLPQRLGNVASAFDQGHADYFDLIDRFADDYEDEGVM